MKRHGVILAVLAGFAIATRGGSEPRPYYEEARAALLAGDAERAENLVSGSSEAASLRLLGEARELQGDLKGAATAYAKAAEKTEGPVADFLAQRAQILVQTAERLASAFGAGLRPAPTTLLTSAPTQVPTASPTQMPSALPTALPTAMATPAATAAPTPGPDQAKADAERAELAKQREELERERQALADEKKRLAEARAEAGQAESNGQRHGNQGFRIVAGVGSHWNQGVQLINDFANDAAQSSGNNTLMIDDVQFPYNFGVGLRWAGVCFEAVFQELWAEYERQNGSSTQNQSAGLKMESYSLGYDWVFASLGSGSSSSEFLLPLRMAYTHAGVDIAGQQFEADLFGPSFGLGFRWLFSEDFSFEATALYHVFVGDSELSLPNPLTMTMNANNPYRKGLSQDGPEARLRLGWRAF